MILCSVVSPSFLSSLCPIISVLWPYASHIPRVIILAEGSGNDRVLPYINRPQLINKCHITTSLSSYFLCHHHTSSTQPLHEHSNVPIAVGSLFRPIMSSRMSGRYGPLSYPLWKESIIDHFHRNTTMARWLSNPKNCGHGASSFYFRWRLFSLTWLSLYWRVSSDEFRLDQLKPIFVWPQISTILKLLAQ